MTLHIDSPHDGQAPRRTHSHEELSLFRVAMDMCGDAIYLVDRTTMRFVDVNQTACTRMGYSRDELLQKGPQDLLNICREEIERLYDEVIAAGANGTITESSARAKDGRESTTELHRRALRMDEGWIIVSIARDITQRKHMEQALLESEARFRSLTELSSDFYWETDAFHRIIESSHGHKHSAVNALGSEIGKTRWDIPSVSPDAAGWAAHRAVVDAHRPFRRFELSRLDAHGVERHLSMTGEPIFDSGGAFSGYRGVGHDISERKRAEEQMQRFKLAMDGSADIFVLIDRKTMRFIDVNSTVTKLLGYSREEMLMMGPQDVLPASREELEKSYDALIASPSTTGTMNSYYRCKDGSQLPFESTRRVLRNRDTWIIAAISRDVREQVAAKRALQDSETRFRLTFELAGSGIAHVDLTGRFRRVNGSFCAIVGYTEKELVGRTVKEISHPQDRDKTDAARAQMHSGEIASMRSQKRYLRKDGAIVWVDLTVALMRDADGKALYEIAVLDDITESMNIESALRESAEELRLFADNVPAMTISWDENLHCRFVNRRYAEFFGSTVENILGKHVREVLGNVVYGEIEGYFAQSLLGHPVVYQRIHKPVNGEPRTIEIKLLPHIGDQGKVLGVFSVATDITEHKLTEERIQSIAHHDSLTGLPNRLLFNDRLLQAINHARRESRQFALLYLDLDKFKPVNDTLGHGAGDELLKEVATRIRRLVRDSDTVARVGGDEFTLILTDAANLEQAEIVVGKIKAALAAPFQLGNQKQNVDIGASIGVALYPSDAVDAGSLVKAADAAMYSAKSVRISMR